MIGGRRSTLLQRAWILDDVGSVTVAGTLAEHALHIDNRWPPRGVDWRWCRLLKRRASGESFVVLGDGHPVAIWASYGNGPSKQPDGFYYRLHYLERSPELAQTALGYLLLCLIASRALELGCKGIVLGAIDDPSVLGFYDRAGATPGAPCGWHVPHDLIPLTLLEPALRRLDDHARLLEAAPDLA